MSIRVIGCAPGDRIVQSDYYRLTFQLSGFATLVDFGGISEVRNFPYVYDHIPDGGQFVPCVPYEHVPGSRAMVVDVKATLSANQTVAQVANVLNSLVLPVDLVQLEHLSGSEAVVGGSGERQQIAAVIDAQPTGLSSLFSDAGSLIKWVVVGLVALAAIQVAKDV